MLKTCVNFAELINYHKELYMILPHIEEHITKAGLAYNLAEFSIERLITDRNDIQKNKYKLISPNNEIFIVNNMRRFCLEYELDHSCLFNICGGAGNRGQHKGWRIEKLARDEITKKISHLITID